MKAFSAILAALLATLLLACAPRARTAARPTTGTPTTAATPPAGAAAAGISTVDEALTSGVDVWGEASLKQPDGPSYPFFEKLLPPLRYVEAPFRVYPIVLAAPGASVKVRLLGDGSQINALARQPNWRGETGIPVTFRVGQALKVFGADPKRLVGPKLAGGYLPVVQFTYIEAGTTYFQETFADVDSFSPKQGVAFARFSVTDGENGRVEAQFDGTEYNEAKDGLLRSAAGKILACFDGKWEFNKARNTLTANLKKGENAMMAIYTIPGDEPIATLAKDDPQALLRIGVDRLQHCADTWNDLLKRGTAIDVPEPVVNNAWRAALI
ncbi:MAG: hypothetical protein ABIP55_06115, partial [Tepidisphaeraceae bacterium]